MSTSADTLADTPAIPEASPQPDTGASPAPTQEQPEFAGSAPTQAAPGEYAQNPQPILDGLVDRRPPDAIHGHFAQTMEYWMDQQHGQLAEWYLRNDPHSPDCTYWLAKALDTTAPVAETYRKECEQRFWSDRLRDVAPQDILQQLKSTQAEGSATGNSPPPAAEPGSGASTQTHIMKEGDTLWGISQSTGIPLEDIQAANPQITDPTKIPVGAEINLPQDKGEGANSGGGQAVQRGNAPYEDELSRAVNGIALPPSGELDENPGKFDEGFPDEEGRGPQAADGDRVSQMVADSSGKVVPPPASSNGQAVLMDPGHGDHNDENSMVDPGAVAKHGGVVYKEKDLSMQFSNAVGNELARLGHNVSYTRIGDVDNADLEKLKWRIDIADKKNPNAFISIHLDSAGKSATGLSVYANQEGADLKKCIEDAVTATDVRDVKPKNLFVLRNNKRPAILIEVGFITNPDDVKAIQNPELAKQVAAGIDAYFKSQSTHTAESRKK